MEPLILEQDLAPGIVELKLNRPAQRNALDAALMAALADAFARHGAAAATRVLLVSASGTSFCAGADLNAMLALGRGPRAASVEDASRLAALLAGVRDCPKPVIACVQGPAFGGGVGLVAACDIAFASSDARFRLPEVQLGLVPAVISPFVLEAIGVRHARRYFLSGEVLGAAEARAIGLVHEVTAPDALAASALKLALEVRNGGPEALGAAKRLITEVAAAEPGAALGLRTAEILAAIRAGGEAQEGVAAALERRSPAWRP